MRLADYTSDLGCFEFEPDTGTYLRMKLAAPRKDRTGYAGMAQLLRSPAEGTVLVTQYLLLDEAWFSIGAEKWRLFDDSLVLTHVDSVFSCELSVHQNDKCIRTFRYRRRDWLAAIIDPAYDHLDFSLAHLPVDFATDKSSSLAKRREDFARMWSSSS